MTNYGITSRNEVMKQAREIAALTPAMTSLSVILNTLQNLIFETTDTFRQAQCVIAYPGQSLGLLLDPVILK